MKRKFWVDFSGYACVEAENAEQADAIMWAAIHNAFNGREVFDDVWDIDCIEERVDEPECEPAYKRLISQIDLEDFWND